MVDRGGCRAGQLVDEWNKKDVEAIIARLADDVVLNLRHPRALPGRRRFKLVGKALVAEHLRGAVDRFFGYRLDRSRDEGDRVVFNLHADGLLTVSLRYNERHEIASIESYRTTVDAPMLSTRMIPRGE